jgi:hypothetical protein
MPRPTSSRGTPSAVRCLALAIATAGVIAVTPTLRSAAAPGTAAAPATAPAAATRAAPVAVPLAAPLVTAASAWIEALVPEQRARALKPLDDQRRTDWHFIPKFERKGLSLRDMNPAQQKLAMEVLRAAVSQSGYDKSLVIMQLDEILRIIEAEKAKNIRDPQRYFFAIFGTPADKGGWALSVEGHHLSLNMVVRDGRIVDSTPQFMGANPAVVKTTFAGLPATGVRVLRDEEELGFELVRSLDATQRGKAIVAAEAPKDIRAAGEVQSPKEPAVGIVHAELGAAQQALLRRLVDVYCGSMTADVTAERLELIEMAPGGWDAVRFAWQGSLEPGVGHGYRVEGPTFVIEFVNVQPDAEGNPANHIHCVWRDKTGDFDLPAE